MQLVASLVSVLLLVWSVRGTALPGEERLQSTRNSSKRKGYEQRISAREELLGFHWQPQSIMRKEYPLTWAVMCLPPPTSLKERSTLRKDVILKMLAGLLDGVDVGREAAFPDVEEEGKLEEERAVLGRLTQLSQRDRKAPCKNFFWKTFTSC